MDKPRIVLIGGGTGSFTLLQSLKRLTPNLTALVNMADDGGSTGVLRDELGVLPPGDVRQCLVALSDAPAALRELFNYRFPEDTSLAGHSFGNLFLSAVQKMSNDFGEAVQLASQVLHIAGQVIPVTLNDCHLHMELGKTKVEGEYAIATTDFGGHSLPKLSLEPHAMLNPVAETALLEADLIVIAPGNLYSSLIPALLPDGMQQALANTKAPIAYVCNLVNKPQQTTDFAVHNYAAELERFIGPVIDYVLYNTDQPSPEILAAYAVEGEYPVTIDKQQLKKQHYKAIGGSFLSHQAQQRNLNDSFIIRSLIRHDAAAITKAIRGLL
jgi:uncharacterized cofD-like protein